MRACMHNFRKMTLASSPCRSRLPWPTQLRADSANFDPLATYGLTMCTCPARCSTRDLDSTRGGVANEERGCVIPSASPPLLFLLLPEGPLSCGFSFLQVWSRAAFAAAQSDHKLWSAAKQLGRSRTEKETDEAPQICSQRYSKPSHLLPYL